MIRTVVHDQIYQYPEACCTYATVTTTMTGLEPAVRLRGLVQNWAYPVLLHVRRNHVVQAFIFS